MSRKLCLVLSIAAAVAFSVVASSQAADRFSVTPIGDSTAVVRILAKKALTTTIYDNQQDINDYKCVNKAIATPTGSGKVSWLSKKLGGGVPGTGGIPSGGSTLSVTFKSVGLYNGTTNLAAMFAKVTKKQTSPPDVSGGSLTYNVNVLQQRKLKVLNKTLALGNVLRGAYVNTAYQVQTKNATDANINSLTSVKTSALELSNATNSLQVAAGTISSGSLSNIAVTGYMKDYTAKPIVLKNSAKGKITVTTNENASVQDGKYASLAVKATTNVGYAAIVGVGGSDFKNKKGKDATVLYANVADGSTLTTDATGGALTVAQQLASTSLSSKVSPKLKGLLDNTKKYGDYTKLYTEKKKKGVVVSRTGKAALYGLVGSEAAILASTAVSGDTTVKMSWRQRTAVESGKDADTTGILPPSAKWLTSDIVKLEGTGNSTYYALQMTFDNKINQAMEYINTGDAGNGSIANELQSLYVAQLGDDGKWFKPGTGSANFKSFSNFLAEKGSSDLASLVGSWGVDPSSSDSGKGYSWVIVKGSSAAQIFAVAPEPSTLVLLGWAFIGAVAYGVRRWRRK